MCGPESFFGNRAIPRDIPRSTTRFSGHPRFMTDYSTFIRVMYDSTDHEGLLSKSLMASFFIPDPENPMLSILIYKDIPSNRKKDALQDALDAAFHNPTFDDGRFADTMWRIKTEEPQPEEEVYFSHPEPDDTVTVSKNARVKARGLKSARGVDLNGRTGIATNWDASRERWIVKWRTGDGKSSIRECNLEVIAHRSI